MCVDADFRCRQQGLAQSVDCDRPPRASSSRRRSRRRRRRWRRSSSISLACRGQAGGSGQVAHHQEPDGVHAEVAGGGDVGGRDVGFGAVGADPHDRAPARCAAFRLGTLAMPGSSSVATRARVDDPGDGFDPFEVGVGAEAVDAARPDSPSPWATSIESTPAASSARRSRSAWAVRVLVADGVHAVAQGDVADVELPGHRWAPVVSSCSCIAMRSAVARAADVMMSRFPA